MQDICGLNCEFDNTICSEKELWHVLKLRIQPEQKIDGDIFYFSGEKGAPQFSEWLRLNNIKKIISEGVGFTGPMETPVFRADYYEYYFIPGL